jgi:APA family basic amino acid/polyamine antiporter
MGQNDSDRGERLERVLGVRQLSANIVNYVVGSGIFVLPAVVAAKLGPAALTAYFTAAVAIALVALCFAECGSRVSASGGTYAYVETAFGPLAGALAGAFGYLSYLLAGAAVANVFVGSLAALWAPAAAPAVRVALIVTLFGVITWLNVRGVAVGARLVVVTTIGKLAPMTLLVLVGAFHVESANFAGFHWPAPAELAATTLALTFAFSGTEGALTPSGEVRDPARTVPRAVGLGVLVVTLLYVSLQVVAQGVLGSDLALDTRAPLAEAARRVAGAPGGTLMLAAAVISTFGYMASNVLSSPRVLYRLALDGVLPRPFAAVHERFHTPHVAIVAHAVLTCALALIGEFGPLALVSAIATLMLYLGCAAATLELRRRDVRAGGPPLLVPGGPIVPVLALGVCGWLLSSAKRDEWLAVAVVGGAVIAVHLGRKLRTRGAGR